MQVAEYTTRPYFPFFPFPPDGCFPVPHGRRLLHAEVWRALSVGDETALGETLSLAEKARHDDCGRYMELEDTRLPDLVHTTTSFAGQSPTLGGSAGGGTREPGNRALSLDYLSHNHSRTAPCLTYNVEIPCRGVPFTHPLMLILSPGGLTASLPARFDH